MRKREVASATSRNERLVARREELKKELAAMLQAANGRIQQLGLAIDQMAAEQGNVQREAFRKEAELKGRIAEIGLLLGDAPAEEKKPAAAAPPAAPAQRAAQ